MNQDYRQLFDTIHKITGVYLQDDKSYLVDSRLSEIMKENSFKSYSELSNKLEQADDKKLINQVIENITTHETRFFRDENMYVALTKQIIPEWMDRNSYKLGIGETLLLKILSIGCSTGQEPYSIAMSISEDPKLSGINFSILALDVSTATIEKARAGEYTEFELSRGVTPQIRAKYFESSGSLNRIKENLKKHISFQVKNIIEDEITGYYDIIFFRNVSIYFEESKKKKLFEKINRALRQDGVLIMGSAESPLGYLSNFIIRECGSLRYYEMKPSNVVLFN
ncbi:MAG: protein-glutamate O-methyltransferase CheR [Leptospira sp.]|nr:protein-glutamate O-methyltransferase CheR [Leptospira sp.]